MTELDVEGLKRLIEADKNHGGEKDEWWAAIDEWWAAIEYLNLAEYLADNAAAIIAALEDRDRLRAELTHCSDELGSTRMALNDEMYKRDAENKEREQLRAWIDNHEYLAAYPSLTECIEDQKRAALEGRDG